MNNHPQTATQLKLMQGAPPPPERIITPTNAWFDEPVRWSFKNIPQLIPCAEAHRGPGPATEIKSAASQLDLDQMTFVDHQNKRATFAEFLADTYTDGFLVIQQGEVVAERYVDMRPHQRHLLQSVSKSLTACLAATFIEEGGLDPAARIADLLPEMAGSAYADATVQQLLDMAVAVDFNEDYEDMSATVTVHTIAGGWFGHSPPAGAPTDAPESLYLFLPTLVDRADFKHGEQFHYVSANTDILAWLLERVGGKRFTQLFEERIWQHLGAEENAAMTVDAWGGAFACGGFCVTLRDLARVGLMVLGNGAYNGRQIVPASFFSDIRNNGDNQAWRAGSMIADLLPTGSYRNQFWVTGNAHGAFFGVGIHGQYLYIDPTAEMVVVKFSSHPVPLVEENSRRSLMAFQALGDYFGGNPASQP